MRALLIPLLAAVLIGSGATLLVLWLRGRRRGPPAAIEPVLQAQGAARCVAGARLLQELARAADQDALERAWEAVEMPLLAALPDCPPDYKIELINALDAAARACTRRDVAKRLMAMRNGLLA